MQLRDYQNNLIALLRTSIVSGNRRAVLCAPTGSGKTRIFTHLTNSHIAKGGKVLILTHRSELLKQAASGFAIRPELIRPNENYTLLAPLHIGMVETVTRRINDLKEFIQSRTLIIIDECHLSNFDKLFPYFPKSAIVLGFTATPYRKGKNITALSELYQDLIQQIDTPELINLGYLSPARSFGIYIDLTGAKSNGEDYDTKEIFEKNRIFEGVVDQWQKHTENTKTILFASNVDSSKRVCEEFKQKGYDAKHIDGSMGKIEREAVLSWFANTKSGIICNCGVLSTGYDQPDIKTVILYRATTSLPLFLQMVGRGSRIAEGKTHFNILDFGMNVSRLGMWEDARTWSLEKAPMRSKKKDAAAIKFCQCGALIPASSRVCPICGKTFQKTEKEMIAELQELSKAEVAEMARTMDLAGKAKLCKAKVLNPRALLHRMTDRREALEFVKLLGYSGSWVHVNKRFFKVLQ